MNKGQGRVEVVGRRAGATQLSGDLGPRMGKQTLPQNQEAQSILGPLSNLMASSATWSACPPLGLRPPSVLFGPLAHLTATASHIWEPRAGPDQCEFVCDYQHVVVHVWCVCLCGCITKCVYMCRAISEYVRVRLNLWAYMQFVCLCVCVDKWPVYID